MSPRQRSLQTIDNILLGLLSQKPMHGYDLYKELARLEGVGTVLRVKQSLLYAILDNLEKQGLLSLQWIQGETRPDRKEYQLTLPGKTQFLAWVSQPVRHGRDMRQDFLARLYFAQQTSPQTAQKLLDGQASACRGWLDGFETAWAGFEKGQTFEKLVLQFRIQQTQGMLQWLDYCKNELTTRGE